MSRWIPLESNPEVLNAWAKKAGLVTKQASFGDVYGLDDELLDMVPKPVKAVILLFPITKDVKAKRKEEDDILASDEAPPVDPTLIFIKQTISNACGTIGLLHALANSNVTYAPTSPLAKFIQQCKGKTPQDRAQLLESTPLFADIHAAAASSGQSAVPKDLDTNLHFTCFVAAPSADDDGTMRVVELDGTRLGPIDRGECTDLLKDAAKVVKEYYIGQAAESVEFSMLALSGGD